MNKPRLAIVSSYSDDADANSTYAQLLERSMARHFDVSIFDLRPKELLKRTGTYTAAGDAHVEAIAVELETFDLVNLQCELGLYGDTIPDVERRLLRLIEASPRLLFTMHRVDTEPGDFGRLYARLLAAIRERGDVRPYFVLTHTGKETRAIRDVFGLTNVVDYPVCYLTRAEKAAILARGDPPAWKAANGFAPDDLVIGRFGVISTYKDHASAIRALDLLPTDYKLAFIGGAHPHGIRTKAVDPSIADLLTLLSDRQQFRTDVVERIRFRGIVDNETFYDALVNVDIVVVPHFEENQSASGVTSVALELGCRVITTYNSTFKEYQRYYPGCFEMFDIGNYYELRDKILFPKAGVADRARAERDRYTPEGLADQYIRLLDLMRSPDYRNVWHASHLDGHALDTQLGEEAEERHRREMNHAEKAFSDAVAVQDLLKEEKFKAEAEVKRLHALLEQATNQRSRADEVGSRR